MICINLLIGQLSCNKTSNVERSSEIDGQNFHERIERMNALFRNHFGCDRNSSAVDSTAQTSKSGNSLVNSFFKENE